MAKSIASLFSGVSGIDDSALNAFKTPEQVREEQLDKLRERSTAQATLLGNIGQRASTALPGIFGSFASSQLPEMAVDLNQATRRGLLGAGSIAGATGRPGVQQALQQAAVSPAERQAGATQEALRQLQGSSPEDMMAVARELQQRGNVQGAQIIMQMAREAQLQQAEVQSEEALATQRQTAAMENLARTQEINERISQGPKPEIGAINPQDYTPASIQKFAETNNFSDLERISKPADDDRTNAEKDLDRWLELLEKEKDQAALAFGRKTGLVPDLSSALEKDYIDSSKAARKSSASALRYNDLANQIIQARDAFGGGAQATWTEGYKELTGDTDAISSLRTRFKAIRGSAAVQNLPPGAASDADVALALQGVPTENANAETVASFLRGLAKLETEVSRYNQAKLKYLDDNRSIVGFESSYADSRRQEAQPQTRTTAGGVTYTIVGE